MIALEGVSKSYPKQSKPAVTELNLQVPEGAVYLLVLVAWAWSEAGRSPPPA